MTVLEDVMQLQNMGYPQEDIVRQLQSRGVSPQEINNALSQAQIKGAISPGQNMSSTQEIPQENYAPTTDNQAFPTQNEYYPEAGGYSDYAPQASNTDTLIEIAEQVVNEKIKPLKKEINELNEFKTIAKTQIENVSDRLKRIEQTIDELQIKILEKVGSYGTNIELIKKEMKMIEDSMKQIFNSKQTTSKIKKE